MTSRVIVCLTGATGQLFGSTALELLKAREEVETHLVLSESAKITIKHESSSEISRIQSLADHTYDHRNVGAPIASGSYDVQGMLVAPCSMKTLSNIAHGNGGNLITRAADVSLKERNPLVLMPREKPYNRIHLQNMLTVTDAGAVVFPPLLSFYQNERSLDSMVERTMSRALEQLDIQVAYDEWNGVGDA